MKLFAAVAPSSTMRRLVSLSVGVVLGVAACGEGGGLVDPPDTRVAQVTVVGPASLQVGGTAQLNATAKNAAGETLQGKNFTWKSSNEAVATVTDDGVVRAQGAGSATITATSEQKLGAMSITVIAVPAIAVAPETVNLTAQEGQSATDSVRVTNGGGGTLAGLTGIVTYAAGQPIGWLNATLRSTNAPGYLVLQANAGNLQPGTYNATVILRSSQAGVAEKSVNVMFTVGQAPAIGLSATSVSFAAVTGEGNPPAQTVAVTNTGGGTLTGLSGIVTYGAGQPTGWLTAALSSTTAPATLTLTPAIAGLQPGTYNATVTLRSSQTGVAERNVNVTLTVAAQPVPIIALAPNSVTFDAVAGQPNPPAKTVSVTNAGPGTLSGLSGVVVYPLGQPAGWLRAELNSTTAPATLTLSVNAAGLQPGTYDAAVILRSSQTGVAEKSVNVTLTVTQAPVATIRVVPETATIQVGGTVDLDAVPLSASGDTLSGRAVTWTSLDTTRATVSSTGLVTGIRPGVVTIRATSEGKTGDATITVIAVPVAPSATTLPATNIAATSATANGTVNPNGVSTTVHFIYGTSSTSLTNRQAPTDSTRTGTSTQSVTATLSGLAADTVYFYRLVARSTAGADTGAVVSFRTLRAAQAPTVTTLSAVNIDTTSATVRGRVNANGSVAQAVFQVSTDSMLATGIRTSDPQSVANDTTLSLVLTGLTPATKYFYRVVATNAGGTAQGSILSFTTSARPVAPSATTGAATNITPTSATANGTVDPNGVNTTVFFIYGTASTSLTNRKAPTDSIRTGTSTQSVTATLSGLAADTVYFYRLVARSTAGADTGAVVSFRTSQAAVAPAIASIALNPDTVNSSSNNVSNRTVVATVGTTGTPTEATVRLEGPGGTPVVTCTDTTLAAGVFECGLEIPRNSVGTYTVRSVVLTYGTGQARTYTTEQLLPLGETTVIAMRN